MPTRNRSTSLAQLLADSVQALLNLLVGCVGHRLLEAGDVGGLVALKLPVGPGFAGPRVDALEQLLVHLLEVSMVIAPAGDAALHIEPLQAQQRGVGFGLGQLLGVGNAQPVYPYSVLVAETVACYHQRAGLDLDSEVAESAPGR